MLLTSFRLKSFLYNVICSIYQTADVGFIPRANARFPPCSGPYQITVLRGMAPALRGGVVSARHVRLNA